MVKPADIRALHRRLLRAGSVASWPSPKGKAIVWAKIRAGFDENRNEQDSGNLKVLVDNASNTILFLLAAGRRRSVEHQIVKNLTSMHYFRTQYNERPPFYNKKLPSDIRDLHNHAYDEFDLTLAMLNKSLGLSLR
ncbi:hypothetical protein BGW37DRAFT_183704 [Umbelopsis sp. PMI_123]|nr:hypothetical protein BGW37DRAFT_183704 [Umbelopsis sp. PMI_123]